MPVLPPNLSLYPVSQVGLGGLNTFDGEDDIADIELADVRNMVFDDGILSPRHGTLQYLPKPTGETNNPLQILVATTSNGYEYLICVYGNNFYLADPFNTQWIKLNQAYTPHIKNLYYGSSNWNKGLTDDRFYIGNGSEDTMKWVMAVTTLSEAALSTDTKLYVNSSVPFVGNTANPFATITDTSIGFNSVGNQITDSNNGFLTAGFRYGDSIKVSGTSSNNGIFTVLSATAGVIITKEPIVTEVSGASVTINQIGIVLVQNGTTALTLYYDSVDTSYTATTIAFTSPTTITDSANGFVSAGFKAGQTIYISGTILNNAKFTIATVSAGTMTVLETIDTEIAGPSVTITTPSLNLDTTAGQNIPAGSTVTTPLIDMGDMPRGKIVTVSQGNLFLANFNGSENDIYFSRFGDPENFTITSGDAESGGFETIYHGKGGIVDMKDFGQYLVIEKQDLLLKWVFSISTGGDLVVNVGPIIAGDGIGPVSNANSLNYMNTLYYPTTKQGIISFAPTITGTQTSSGLSITSGKINNLVTEVLDFTLARTAGLAQKLYWTCALPTVGINTNVNNIVLMYDLLRAQMNPTKSAWTIFNNWNATDLKPINNKLYYLSLNDGAVYECFTQGYQDAIDTQPTAYTAYALTKRFNLNSNATLMRPVYVYLEGFVSLNTTFYVRILDNEAGSLGSQSYAISGTNQTITSSTFSGGLGRFKLASPLLGGPDLETINGFINPLFFRVYLEVSQAFRPHNLQAELFSTAIGSQWAVTNITLMTLPEKSVETALVMSPAAAPQVQL